MLLAERLPAVWGVVPPLPGAHYWCRRRRRHQLLLERKHAAHTSTCCARHLIYRGPYCTKSQKWVLSLCLQKTSVSVLVLLSVALGSTAAVQNEVVGEKEDVADLAASKSKVQQHFLASGFLTGGYPGRGYPGGYPGGGHPGGYPSGGYPGGYPSAGYPGGYPGGGYPGGYPSGGYPGGYPSEGYPGGYPSGGYPGGYPGGGYPGGARLDYPAVAVPSYPGYQTPAAIQGYYPSAGASLPVVFYSADKDKKPAVDKQ
ncbi:hypothetical protein PR048_016042 [Dryococelus australis]|uniref:Uncharacterized protein n=1 Tax=Dryococelus australis TaxID=614101 RepID=A0ABQ9HJ11_9NEOP|nr:hypothetical protein PR048_016042 [Dryococelus australis]